MVELKNEQLSIVVSEKGAELQSIKDASGKDTSGRPTPNSGDVTHQYFSLSYAPSTVRLIE